MARLPALILSLPPPLILGPPPLILSLSPPLILSLSTPLVLSLSKDEAAKVLTVRQAHRERKRAHRERRVKRRFGPILASRREGGQKGGRCNLARSPWSREDLAIRARSSTTGRMRPVPARLVATLADTD